MTTDENNLGDGTTHAVSRVPIAKRSAPRQTTNGTGNGTGHVNGTGQVNGRRTVVVSTSGPKSSAEPSGGDRQPDKGNVNGARVAKSRTRPVRRKRPSPARTFFDWAVVIAVALAVAVLIRTFLIAHFVVDGSSMVSTLHNHDRVFVNKMSYHLHDPNRGDVIVLHESSGIDRDLIKRVIALPGETVEMTNCVVKINGQVLDEPYLDPTIVTPGNCGSDQPPLVVPNQTVFVMGDNRPGSQDSRALGPISYDDLVGRAFVVFWPQSDWKWL